jgi:TPR repeat protein
VDVGVSPINIRRFALEARWQTKQHRHAGQRRSYGQGLPKDQAAAVKWLQKSAAQGNAPAQHVLGLSHATGGA